MQRCGVKPTCRNALYSIQLVAAVAFATACDPIVDPALPTTATLFVPPPVYEKWWAMTETCSGVPRPLEDVAWFLVPGVSSFQLNKEAVSGYWTQGSNRVVLAGASRLDGSVVRHEMLHALIRTSGHPRSYFLGKCAGVVSCTPRCVSDAGQFPSASVAAQPVLADSIDVSVALIPGTPTVAVDSGVFSMVITAHNRASHPVTVPSSSLNSGFTAPFSFEIRLSQVARIAGTLDLDDPSVTTFAAGETKKQYFDFVIGNALKDRTVTSGVYRVTGSYSTHSAVLTSVVIGQQ